ncbi:hypothetical protein KHP11_29130 [Rhodococcus erythropolis]|uniref:hypothetical protein n=1 Tax=Rhodococcus erythropolis TaxID=1833 RepID=UPI00111308E9|nr:hypothetical protein [Rhodococcus erythropolis]MBT1258522.1 hypothetical protein [Rhodococcus erythropolis]
MPDTRPGITIGSAHGTVAVRPSTSSATWVPGFVGAYIEVRAVTSKPMVASVRLPSIEQEWSDEPVFE